MDNKFNISEFGGGKSVTNIIYIGEVVHIDDPSKAGRIKVRIPALDRQSPIFCKKNSKAGKKNVYNIVQGSGSKIEITDTKIIGNLDKTSGNDTKNNSSNNPCTEIPWSSPLTSKFFQTTPKLGEMVQIILFDSNKPQMNRVWVGPVISQLDRLSYDDVRTAGSVLNSATIPVGSDKTDLVKLNKRGTFTGGFPEPLDISILSRNNADIVLPSFDKKRGNISKNGEVLIRAGKFKFNSNPLKNGLELNDENPAYFRLKVLAPNSSNIRSDGTVETQPSTHSMLFSDYVSIVSHRNGEEGSDGISKINPIPQKDGDIMSIHNGLQPLIRGDYLIDFLTLLVDYVANHNHPYHALSPTNSNSKPDLLKFDLNKLRSTNIRIN